MNTVKGSLVVRRLKGIKAAFSPDILFLLETKNPDDVVRDVAAQLDMIMLSVFLRWELGVV